MIFFLDCLWGICTWIVSSGNRINDSMNGWFIKSQLMGNSSSKYIKCRMNEWLKSSCKIQVVAILLQLYNAFAKVKLNARLFLDILLFIPRNKSPFSLSKSRGKTMHSKDMPAKVYLLPRILFSQAKRSTTSMHWRSHST